MKEKLPYYQFGSLNNPERLTIYLTYLKSWRRFVKHSKASKVNRKRSKDLFLEIHTRYYKTVIKGPKFVTAERLIRNFFLLKLNENLRLVLSSLNPYNLTAFVQGVRSQIELNALLQEFSTNKEYHKEFLLMNEDRTKVKEIPTVKNILTLIQKLDTSLIDYKQVYNEFSSLLHPNPSAVKFYAQAEKRDDATISKIMAPRLKYYFDETITKTPSMNEWFDINTYNFLTYIDHFLMIYDFLDNEFFITEEEKEQAELISIAQVFDAHKKQFLKVANRADKENLNIENEVNKVWVKILNDKK